MTLPPCTIGKKLEELENWQSNIDRLEGSAVVTLVHLKQQFVTPSHTKEEDDDADDDMFNTFMAAEVDDALLPVSSLLPKPRVSIPHTSAWNNWRFNIRENIHNKLQVSADDANINDDLSMDLNVYRPITPTTLSSPLVQVLPAKRAQSLVVPTPKKKKAHRSSKAMAAKKVSSSSRRRRKRSSNAVANKMSNKACSLPTRDDPEDELFLASLHSKKDKGHINDAHIEIRRHVLEVHRTISGRVYFQCGCCAHINRKERTRCSTIAPQSVNSLYRGFVRFMMIHVPACEHIPEEFKTLNSKKKIAKRSKQYWVECANAMGFRDGNDGEGIVYCCPPVSAASLAPTTAVTVTISPSIE